ncbi:MAG: 3-oxoacyl-ACP synthase, partial [Acidobacteria bacterium]|nr:3-oxoacyl-ACP synthase [Acidobacteriota bacterium]
PASSTLLVANEAPEPFLGPFVYGTDGSGAGNLIVATGGMRLPRTAESAVCVTDSSGNLRSRDHLFMNGAEMFTFALESVPSMVRELLRRAEKTIEEIDLFVFHQANKYMLDQLRKATKIPAEKFYVALREYGNTVSSSIPIALKLASAEKRLKAEDRVLLAGYGVGYSGGATLIRWLG